MGPWLTTGAGRKRAPELAAEAEGDAAAAAAGIRRKRARTDLQEAEGSGHYDPPVEESASQMRGVAVDEGMAQWRQRQQQCLQVRVCFLSGWMVLRSRAPAKYCIWIVQLMELCW